MIAIIFPYKYLQYLHTYCIHVYKHICLQPYYKYCKCITRRFCAFGYVIYPNDQPYNLSCLTNYNKFEPFKNHVQFIVRTFKMFSYKTYSTCEFMITNKLTDTQSCSAFTMHILLAKAHSQLPIFQFNNSFHFCDFFSKLYSTLKYTLE